MPVAVEADPEQTPKQCSDWQWMLLEGACSSCMQTFTRHLVTGSRSPDSASVLALNSHYVILKMFPLPPPPPNWQRVERIILWV